MSCLDDATVLGLVEGRLAPEHIARVDEHIDSCASCREVVTRVAGSRSSVRVLARGDTVGRYVIGDVLGTGAMGRVYSAWEPELDRRVAIKVLLDEGDRDRLVREAQAMARLNHPNVVTVHEVGATDAGVFVAMELVDGETLRAFAELSGGERSRGVGPGTARSRGWRDVTRMLAEVARGLAAVHAAGVVHRDVKPDNVIVGADGRVRIGDFGLARSGGGAAREMTATAAPARAALAEGTLSAATAVAGTPAYMAPEVLRGGAAGAASDQFSFGVMAYELLAGKRPFAGATWTELLASIEAGDVRRIPDVPRWLDDAIRRCIAHEPAARHPSMRAVAERFDAGARRRSPVLWLAGLLGVAVLASALTWTLVRQGDRGRSGDALVPAWNEAARTQLAKRGVPARTLAAIEGWNAAWTVERDDARRSARSDHADRVAARERCLVQRRDELAALLDASSAAPERLLDAVATLPAPIECRTADADPLPLDPAKAREADAVLARLPALRAAVALSQSDLAGVVTNSAALVDKARTSTHAPTLADALLVHAEALRAVDRSADAAAAARDAVAAADRGHADLLRARAWLARVAIAGEQRDLTSADDLGTLAHAAIERIGAPHLAASLARLRGLIAYNRGRHAEARELLLGARSQLVTLGGEHTLDIAAVDSALGSVARAAGDLDEAERRHRATLALDRELRGTSHRDIARDLHNIAGVLRLRGDLDTALATYREALAVEIATQGERSIAAALTHNSIGLVELARADHAAARVEFMLARDILTAANHGDRGFAEHNLGLAAQAQGTHAVAVAHFERAAAIYDATIGRDAPAAQRLVDDRRRSEQATRVTAARPTADTTPAPAGYRRPPPAAPPRPAPAPQPHKDVGVYGSAQSW